MAGRTEGQTDRIFLANIVLDVCTYIVKFDGNFVFQAAESLMRYHRMPERGKIRIKHGLIRF